MVVSFICLLYSKQYLTNKSLLLCSKKEMTLFEIPIYLVLAYYGRFSNLSDSPVIYYLPTQKEELRFPSKLYPLSSDFTKSG